MEENINYKKNTNTKNNEDGNEYENEVGIEDEDEDEGYNNEMARNIEYKTITDSKNQEDDDDDDDDGDDVGYESWTKGNWCWLLSKNNSTPTSTTTTSNKNTHRVIRANRYCIGETKTYSNNERWNIMFHRLEAYKEKNQTTNVRRKEDPQLGYWASNQRQNYKNEILPEHRLDLLDSIGFVWKIVDQVPWMEMYQRLISYKRQHNSTSVPQGYIEDPKLGTWTVNQRQRYKNKELSFKRINCLESIGFVWKLRDLLPWIEMFQRLVAFKECHQSTLVPRVYTKDPRLGCWVRTQRCRYKKSILSKRRMELLNSIDFVWRAR